MKAALLDDLVGLRRQKKTTAVLTNLIDGRQSILIDGQLRGELDLEAPQMAELQRRARQNATGLLSDDLFLRVYAPPLRLVVVGAVHVSQALVPIAHIVGFETVIIDPRTAFATAERFPDTEITHEWPDAAMSALAPDHRTAIVTLTHDPKLDDPALLIALQSDAFYIGALGSRKTSAKRRERLIDAGVGEAQLDRIHAPVGLPLGGRRPPEIAVSILAQIIGALHAGD